MQLSVRGKWGNSARGETCVKSSCLDNHFHQVSTRSFSSQTNQSFTQMHLLVVYYGTTVGSKMSG